MLVSQKIILPFFIGFVFLISFAGTANAGHMIIIGVDGLGTYGVTQAKAVNMKFMMENGAHTLHARGVLPSSSSPNWMSIISGASPSQHGVTSNAWERDTHALPPLQTGAEDIFPTIFSVLKKQRPNAKAGAFYQWEGFDRLFEKSTVHQSGHFKTEEETTRMAAAYLEKEKPELLFVHLDHVDGAGHTFGHRTSAYYEAVEKADRLIGQIMESARRAGTFEDTVFLLISDHGGIGKGHGGESLGEVEIPFILYGKGVKQGHTIQHAVYNFDAAATAAFVLEVTPPYAWIGRAVTSAFDGHAIPPHSTIPDYAAAMPRMEPEGGLFRVPSVEVTLKSPQAGSGLVYYTLDGRVPTQKDFLYQGPFLLRRDAVVRARTKIQDGYSSESKAYFRLFDPNQAAPVRVTYFEQDEVTTMPPLGEMVPQSSTKSFEIDLSGLPHRDQDYAFRFETEVKIPATGLYTFYLNSDDGSTLSLGGKMVVDHSEMHGYTEKTGEIHLVAGRHPLQVDYFQHGGGEGLQVFIKGPDLPKQVLSPSFLSLPNSP